jgi:hypothetical protein
MKRKVKKYAGGTLVDSSGNPVRSSSGEPVRTRFGKDDEDRPRAGPDDYATMGKRAGATSTMSGPKEYISESIKEDTEKDTDKKSSKGIFSGSAAADDSDTYAPKTRTFSTTGPEKKKSKPKPRYSGVVSAEEMGSQDFSSAAKSPASGSDVSAPGGKMIDRNSRDFAGVKSASGNSYLSPPKYGANKISDEEAAQIEKKRSVANAKKMAATAAENKSKSATSLKSPGSKMDMNDPYSMSLGSEFDPKGMMRRNSRLTGDMDYKRGGAVKKMASGGKVSSASSRGDGIAQRGKTKGRMC